MIEDVGEWLTIRQTCNRLDVSEKTLRRMFKDGTLPPPIRFNARRVRIPLTDIVSYLQKVAEQRRLQAPA